MHRSLMGGVCGRLCRFGHRCSGHRSRWPSSCCDTCCYGGAGFHRTVRKGDRHRWRRGYQGWQNWYPERYRIVRKFCRVSYLELGSGRVGRARCACCSWKWLYGSFGIGRVGRWVWIRSRCGPCTGGNALAGARFSCICVSSGKSLPERIGLVFCFWFFCLRHSERRRAALWRGRRCKSLGLAMG